jgi:uncharacterized protein (DUF983 family)
MARCPNCGSNSIERFTNHGLSCTACGHDARSGDFDEQSCPGHVASRSDPKICGRCGTHVDSMRPDDGEQ